jgi:hypothetical protein
LAHLDQHPAPRSVDNLEFEVVNGREPRQATGCFEDVVRNQDAPFLGAFIDAWKRRLPGLVCPLKLQDGVLYFRTLGNDSSEVWQQKTDAHPQARWRAVQRDATGNDCVALGMQG